MKGYTQILVAKSQAEAMLAEPKLGMVRAMLQAIVRDLETPGLPRHVVERNLSGLDTLVNTIAQHGGLVK